MIRSSRPDRPRGGFTLVEATLSVVFAALLAGAVLSLTGRSSEAFRSVRSVADTTESGRRSLERVREILSTVDATTVSPQVAPPLHSSFVDFQRPPRDTADPRELDDPERLAFVAAPEDRADGIDNDGDGLVDEGELVWITDFGTLDAKTHVLARDVTALLEGELPNGRDDNGNGLVDERGASFEFDRGCIHVHLTLGVCTDGESTHLRTFETVQALLD